MHGDPEAVHRGDVLGGRFQVERVLGRGGMAVVIKVIDLETREPRALKILGASARASVSAVERFSREARALAQLGSEHAVRVLDVGAFADGAPYMVMEYLEGTDLGALVKRRGALPAHEAIAYVLQACKVVAEAHAHGIVHRDLKPQNLFLTRRADGSACLKVLDFGISKQLGLGEGEADLTLSNAVLGSPAYMSPEQIRSARSVDARSDLWSLGVVLYQLVTGRLPFRSGNASDLVALIVTEAPERPSKLRAGLPLALDGVILRCLEKDPEARFQSATELAAALAPFVPRRRGTPSRPDEEAISMPRSPRARAIVIAAGALAVIALIAASALLLR
jgi:serine/threonine-protein kinase